MKCMVSTALVFLSLSGPAVASVPAKQAWTANLEPGKGFIMFNAVGRPSALKIKGKGEGPKGSIRITGDKASGTLQFNLTTLDTGIGLRNQHMKEKYLETGKFSDAVLKVSELQVPEALRSGDGSVDGAPFQAILSLHGVEKPVSGTAKLKRAGSALEIQASFGLKLSEYGISTPSFAGITVAEDVQVAVETSAPITTSQ